VPRGCAAVRSGTDAEVVLDQHHQLERIDRIDAQPLDEIGAVSSMSSGRWSSSLSPSTINTFRLLELLAFHPVSSPQRPRSSTEGLTAAP
jgi:hypothetical protein